MNLYGADTALIKIKKGFDMNYRIKYFIHYIIICSIIFAIPVAMSVFTTMLSSITRIPPYPYQFNLNETINHRFSWNITNPKKIKQTNYKT